VPTDTNTTYSVQDGELSQNNLTNTLKGYYDTGYTHSQAAHAPSGAEANAANTAITTADTSWTGSQRATLVVDNDGSFDMNLGQNFKCSVSSGNVTLTFGSIANGQSGFILLINSGATMLAASTTKVDASLLTTISTAGTYLISYLSDGSNVYLTNSAIYT
jgi:ABC-type proline/glycine betaine transport system substrate-binding protein